MIVNAALSMREVGVDGTSFTQVLERSGASRGSIYHHFPGGKAELVEEATRYAGEFIASGLVTALREDDPAGAVRDFAAAWRDVLERGGYTAGCTIVAATLEGDRSPAARDAAQAAFERWETLLADAMAANGVAADRARSLATLAIASIEGAVILARAQRSPEPLDRVAGELAALVAGATEG